MARPIESQPTPQHSLVKELSIYVTSQIQYVENARIDAGTRIRQKIGIVASRMDWTQEGIVPDTIDVEDVTPYTGHATLQTQTVRWLKQGNQLVVVTKTIATLEDFRKTTDPRAMMFARSEEIKPRYHSLPENQQYERETRAVRPEEWIEFGPLLVKKLQEIEQKSHSKLKK